MLSCTDKWFFAHEKAAVFSSMGGRDLFFFVKTFLVACELQVNLVPGPRIKLYPHVFISLESKPLDGKFL